MFYITNCHIVLKCKTNSLLREVFSMSIVCTGYGVLAPRTKNIEDFLFNLKNGVCCLEITYDYTPNNESNIWGIIKEGLEGFEHDKLLKRLPRVTKIALTAAKEAIHSSKIELSERKAGLFFGNSLGGSWRRSISEWVY